MNTGHPPDDELLDFARGLDAEGVISAHLEACWRCRLVLAELIQPTSDFAPSPEPPTKVGYDPLVGQTIGDYVVRERLAQGGTGLLYRGETRRTQKPVVIKLLPPHLADDVLLSQRLLREARAVNLIRHPNVIDIFAVGQLPGSGIYLVMQLLEGDALADLLRSRQPVAAASVESVLEQALAGLEAAHAVGVVHRDVKPENLFVTPKDGGWKVTLIDFGFARELGGTRLTVTNHLLGTPGYMAPEQLRGGEAVPASDVYALGVVAFEALAGRPPYEGASQLDVMQQHLDAPVPSVRSVQPDVPAALDQLVGRMMAKDPAARPTAADARQLLLGPPTMRLGVRPDPSLLKTAPDQRAPPAAPVQSAARKSVFDTPAIVAGFVLGALAALGLFWLLK